MQKILLFSNDVRSSQLIRSTLESKLPYPITSYFDPKSTLDAATTRLVNLLIYDLDMFSQEQLDFLAKVRTLGYHSPLLLLAKTITIPNLDAIQKLRRFHLLRKPFEEKELIGITRKILYTKNLPQQQFKRFRTNQHVNVEPLTNGNLMSSSVYNLSVGGAYMEYSGLERFGVGDVLKMKFQLEDLSSERIVNAKVIWTTRKGSYSGRTGAGLKFVKSSELYKHLIDKL